jgi:hypothetical protein
MTTRLENLERQETELILPDGGRNQNGRYGLETDDLNSALSGRYRSEVVVTLTCQLRR